MQLLTDVKKAIKSGMFNTAQYSLSFLSSRKETDIELAFSFLYQFENIIPIWGIQRMKELKQIVELSRNPSKTDKEFFKRIKQEKNCWVHHFVVVVVIACPAEIPISMAARIKFLLKRTPYKNFLTPQWQENMLKIKNCRECELCKSKCPYNLNIPEILKEMLDDYIRFAENLGINVLETGVKNEK